MALLNCPNCDGKVSSFAEKCPHCDYPMQGGDGTGDQNNPVATRSVGNLQLAPLAAISDSRQPLNACLRMIVDRKLGRTKQICPVRSFRITIDNGRPEHLSWEKSDVTQLLAPGVHAVSISPFDHRDDIICTHEVKIEICPLAIKDESKHYCRSVVFRFELGFNGEYVADSVSPERYGRVLKPDCEVFGLDCESFGFGL